MSALSWSVLLTGVSMLLTILLTVYAPEVRLLFTGKAKDVDSTAFTVRLVDRTKLTAMVWSERDFLLLLFGACKFIIVSSIVWYFAASALINWRTYITSDAILSVISALFQFGLYAYLLQYAVDDMRQVLQKAWRAQVLLLTATTVITQLREGGKVTTVSTALEDIFDIEIKRTEGVEFLQLMSDKYTKAHEFPVQGDIDLIALKDLILKSADSCAELRKLDSGSDKTLHALSKAVVVAGQLQE